MKSIIICEKPSLAGNMRDGINESFSNHDGYYESEHFIITYVFGHLLELKSIEAYRKDYNPNEKYKWTLEGLPYYPNPFSFVLKNDKGVKNQFKIIKTLLNRNDIDKVYHLGDADREGEIIVRNILNATGNKKPVLRIWSDDQTPESLSEALSDAKSDREYDALANEGYARTYIDWLYGINLSRLVTLKVGRLERIGRCIMAIVKEIYNREMEIKFFVPRHYYGIASETKINDLPIVLKSKEEFDIDKEYLAQELCDKYNNAKTVVSNVIKNERTVSPTKPFSITTLQNAMGKKYKIKPNMVLTAAQSLYEQGILSYPRTNSSYYAKGEYEKVDAVLKQLKKDGYDVSVESGKKFFNDKYVESHGALRLTKLVDQSKLKDTEAKVYEMVLTHMLANFCEEECKMQDTFIFLNVGDMEEIKVSGRIILSQGYLKYESDESKNKLVPDLKIGDVVKTAFKPIEKETAPPKRYTIETLNNYCENPFRKEKEDTEDGAFRAIVDGLAIGTGATRAGLIQNGVENGYFSLKKDTYYLEENGKFVIDMLGKLHIDMDKFKTAEIGKVLKKVSRGEMSLNQALYFAERQITIYFNGAMDIAIEKKTDSSGKEVIGMCPKCNSPVYESKTNFYCSNKECNFALFKENKWWTMKNKTITKTYAKGLLKNGRVKVTGLYSSQKDKLYDAFVVMEVKEQYPSFSLEFNNKSKK